MASVAQGLHRIGILTGGGDCPGINAVLRAVTKAAIYRHGLEVLGIEDGFEGLLENRIRPLTAADVSNILTLGGTILGASNRCDPRDATARCLTRLADAGIDALVVIGGDGTMSIAAHMVAQGVNCIGVPKTIDNDLAGTELTFGFLTAVATATDALDRVHTTAASHHRAMVVEVMGRYAGWIALHAGVAGGADVILIPEIPFNIRKVCDFILARRGQGKRFSVICISEGARAVGGEPSVSRVVSGSPDPIRLGGVGQKVAAQIEEITGVESRTTVLGHVQRGGAPVAADRVLATQFGVRAADLLAAGARNRLVVMKSGEVTDVELTGSAVSQRLVPPGHPLVEAARQVGTCFGD